MEALEARGHSIEKGEGLRDKSRSKSRAKKSKGKFWYYNKAGHLKKYCWKRKEENDESKKEASPVEENSSLVGEVLFVCNILQHQDEWILDFGASDHMCPHRSWFSSYQPIDKGVVFIGNNASCKNVGIGSIRVKIFDGVVKTLTGVRHAPKLKKINFLGCLGFW